MKSKYNILLGRKLFLTIITLLLFVPSLTHAALTDNLISFWNLNESSGTRNDVISTNHLAEVGGAIPSAIGVINNAPAFSSSKYLSINDNAELSTGDIDFTVAGWVYLDSKASPQGIVSKYDGSSNSEFMLYYASGTDRLTFLVTSSGSSATQVSVAAEDLGSPAINTWYYVVGWHDSVNNTINIQVNNGAVNSTATTLGVFDGTAPFLIGSYSGGTRPLSGRVDSVGLWKRVLTTNEKNELYASGAGFEHPFLPATAPGAPTGITFQPKDNSVALRWFAPDSGNSAITDYIIQYKLTASGSWTTFSDGTSVLSSTTVTGLTNENSYDFRIAAVNNVGTGEYSTPMTGTILATTLDDDLISFWNLNETSGVRYDVVNSNDVSQVGGTISSTVGVIGNAPAFSSDKYLSINDNAELSTGNIDFTVAGWVYLDSKASPQGIVSKYDGTTNREFMLYYASGTDRLTFLVTSGGSVATQVLAAANDLGSPAINTWYYVVGWHDSVNNTINIQVNNGAVNSTATTLGVFDGTAPFRIGSYSGTTGPLNGRVDSVGLWKRVLTTQERTDLYFGSLGVQYPFDPDASNTITIIGPLQYQTFQRSSESSGSIPISGTYSGTPTTIEASWNGGAYQVIDNSLSNGFFSGTLTSQTPGQGTLTVRFTNDTAVTATQTYVGLGDVYVVAGQSNAMGRGAFAQLYTHPTLKASIFNQNDQWLEGNDPTDIDTNDGSPWPLLSTYIMDDQSVPVAFITTATGGTGLVSPNDWEKGGGGGEYERMITQITDSGVNSVKAVLWHQGEQDVNSGVSRATYNAAIDTLAGHMAADIVGAPKLVLAQIGYKTTSGAVRDNVDAVRLAQSDAWDDNPGVVAGPILYDIGPLSDGVHFSTNEEIEALAERWWASLNKEYYGGTDGRGPILTAAEHNEAKSEITLTFSDDSLPITPSTGLSGFRVEEDTVSVPISSVTRIANNKLRIVLTSAATGALTVSLGSFNDGAGVTIPKDSSAYALPAEIFVDYPTTLAVDTGAPTIDSVTSNKTTGTYGVGEVIDIDVTFSEAVTSASVTVTLETGDIDRTCTFSISNSSTGSCDYTVQVGDTSAVLTVASISGSIVDEANNAMTDFEPTINLFNNPLLVIDTTTSFRSAYGSYSKTSPFFIQNQVISNSPLQNIQKYIFTRNFKIIIPRIKGEDVKVLQEFLNFKGYTIPQTAYEKANNIPSSDGVFGPLTKKAVISFQLANGLVPDGIVGPKTLAKIKELAH